MLVGKELILATKPFAKEIRWKSWYYTLTSIALLVLFILGTFYVPYLAGKIVCSVFSGFLLIRCFIIFHDFQHHSILKKSFFANGLFTIFGMYMLTPPSIWKRSHDHHHNNNSKLFSASIGSFPIMTKEKFLRATEKEKKMYLAVRHPLNMLFSYISVFMFGMCLQSFISSPRRHWDSLVVLALHFAIVIVLLVLSCSPAAAGPVTLPGGEDCFE